MFQDAAHIPVSIMKFNDKNFVRFFLILVSLFYVEVSVTGPVFLIWYCTRGFLFRLKVVLPPS